MLNPYSDLSFVHQLIVEVGFEGGLDQVEGSATYSSWRWLMNFLVEAGDPGLTRTPSIR